MKGESRVSNPAPATDINRNTKSATSYGCEQCGGPLNRGSRFCSYRCYGEFRRGRPLKKIKPLTSAEMVAQMHAALDKLQRLVLDGEETPS